MVKTGYCEKTGLKKGAWTPDEDEKLTDYIKKYGHWNWRELPRFAGLKRCGKSCRLRWVNYLRPNIRRGLFSEGEDELIMNLHESLGNKWAAIAAKLPGRTDNEVKNHWHTNLKKRLKQMSENNLHSHEISECKAGVNDMKELEPDAPFSYVPMDEIGSSPSSSQLPSSDSAAVNGTHWFEDDNIALPETCPEAYYNFWTEPFLAGNSYIDEIFFETSVESDLVPPLSLLPPVDPLCVLDFYSDDNMDLFNQLW
ncbi:PREDICTED: myb-related protein Myb4-like [Nelumbo nucifera]|uniref:Myb-related protein Myb4-like n=2 Tax=Nelumbo nucifera TaxID=4432 RepID=A0A1U8AN20_NELNU|nr:PREDICTED: myb-related protein Myb4-like [Nelumbo nucifera]DAD23104.1 TPA_asm: hypothetical protein HUJ06_024567 [Nelumbo nucifera]